MNPGELRHRITIQQLSSSQDTYGENVDTWVDVATVYAAVNPISGRELFAAEKENSEITHRVKIRYRSGITPDMRVLFEGREFSIMYVIDYKERHIELQLMCKEMY